MRDPCFESFDVPLLRAFFAHEREQHPDWFDTSGMPNASHIRSAIDIAAQNLERRNAALSAALYTISDVIGMQRANWSVWRTPFRSRESLDFALALTSTAIYQFHDGAPRDHGFKPARLGINRTSRRFTVALQWCHQRTRRQQMNNLVRLPKSA